jgi:uncharacterized membrane protein (UPF0127 family)
MIKTGELHDARTGQTLVPKVRRAGGTIERMVGFLGRRTIGDDEALWFDRCSAVHTMGMHVPIDVVFLDGRGIVLRVVSPAVPWHPWIAARGARSVLELACGNAARSGVTQAMHLEIVWDSLTSSS